MMLLKAYATSLARQLAPDPAANNPASDWRERNMPLLDRLRKLVDSIPEEEREQPRSLEWFRVRLLGRGVGKCARAGEVSDCLRSLGWQRRRIWGNPSGPSPSRWSPPKSTDQAVGA